jgi:hypothetical protein
MSSNQPLVHGPKFNVTMGVKYKGELWHISGCSGGPLLGFVYLLTGLGGKQVSVSEEELEPWTEK